MVVSKATYCASFEAIVKVDTVDVLLEPFYSPL